MTKKNKFLPTKSNFGGGLNNPIKLQRYNKNAKEKKVFIISALLFLLIFGGIKLYRTFALYKEEKTFNVLNGNIPSFCSKIYEQEDKGNEEKILNGSTPTLKDNLIPIFIDDCGQAHKADANKKWYDYENKMWANAVILVDGVEDNYQNGERIPEENIESYFVWIPKYSYKLFDDQLGNYSSLIGGDKLSDEENAKVLKSYQDKGPTTAIEIRFGTTNTSDNNENECTTPGKSGEIGSCEVGDYMTHPAFTSFGDITGFWVGKFETSRSDITPESKEITFSDDNLYQEYANKLLIKPNTYSWRNIKIDDMFNVSYYYQRELDSHMMKNTEWGAVAYLTNSIYGTCTKDEDKTTCTDVRINNNSAYMTGYSAINAPTTGKTNTSISCKDYPDACNEYCAPNSLGIDSNCNYNYINAKSGLSSTTGNYYGIYDMNGGTWEWTIAFAPLSAEESTLTVNKIPLSEFKLLNSDNSSKYYDVYNYSKNGSLYSNRILGDATGELGPFYRFKQPSATGFQKISSWYHDVAVFFDDGDAQSIRSGSFQNGNEAGIYYFNKTDNLEIGAYAFRITLAF